MKTEYVEERKGGEEIEEVKELVYFIGVWIWKRGVMLWCESLVLYVRLS